MNSWTEQNRLILLVNLLQKKQILSAKASVGTAQGIGHKNWGHALQSNLTGLSSVLGHIAEQVLEYPLQAFFQHYWYNFGSSKVN